MLIMIKSRMCKMQIFSKLKILLSCFATLPLGCSDLNAERIQTETLDVDVIQVQQLKSLKLFLNNDRNQGYQSFKAVSADLKDCEQLQFAMNAGMYHADFSPVGLYVEQGILRRNLNFEKGFGNFFMQPNGVLAWNADKAVIRTTA